MIVRANFGDDPLTQAVSSQGVLAVPAVAIYTAGGVLVLGLAIFGLTRKRRKDKH